MTIYKGQNNMKLSHITLMMKPHNIFVPFLSFLSAEFCSLSLCCCASCCLAVAVTLKGIGKLVVRIGHCFLLRSNFQIVFLYVVNQTPPLMIVSLYFWEGCLWKYSPLSNEQIVGKFLWSFNDRSQSTVKNVGISYLLCLQCGV